MRQRAEQVILIATVLLALPAPLLAESTEEAIASGVLDALIEARVANGVPELDRRRVLDRAAHRRAARTERPKQNHGIYQGQVIGADQNRIASGYYLLEPLSQLSMMFELVASSKPQQQYDWKAQRQ